MNNLILIGFKGAGKTTLGRQIATKLQRPLIDTDDLFEEPPKVLYQKIGAQLFYAKEKELIQSLKHVTGAVIATGGGTPLLNGDFLRQLGTVVHLQTPCAVIEERIGSHPFLAEYDMRLGIYQKIAHHNITTEDELWEVIRLDPFSASPPGESRMALP